MLFNDTIGYNIAYGREGATTGAAIAVLGSALIDTAYPVPAKHVIRRTEQAGSLRSSGRSRDGGVAIV